MCHGGPCHPGPLHVVWYGLYLLPVCVEIPGKESRAHCKCTHVESGAVVCQTPVQQDHDR